MSQQPVEVYPTVYPVPIAQRPQPSNHSNGSFGTVFMVLAIIVVVSAIACVLGRLCSRQKHSKGKQNKADLPPKERDAKKNNASQFKERDIEFGFDKRLASAKVAAHEDFRGPKATFHKGKGEGDIEFGFDKRVKPSANKGVANEDFGGPKPFHNGQFKKEVRFANDGELN